jgi:hypothetical protein
MGEFTRTSEHGKTLAFALRDIFTAANFAIAMVSAIVGHAAFEFLRKRVLANKDARRPAGVFLKKL